MQDTSKKALIISLLDGWPSYADRITSDTIDAYLESVSDCSIDALGRSCQQFSQGKVEGFNPDFGPPSASRLAQNARQWNTVLESIAADRALAARQQIVAYPVGGQPPEGYSPLGPIEVDFGQGRIDMRAMTTAEKDEIMRNKGRPQIGSTPEAPRLRRMDE